MIITFIGNRPQTQYIKIGVQGNNLVDELEFLLARQQEGIDLFQYKPKLKIASKNHRYAEITKNLTVEHIAEFTEDAKLKITYKIPDEVTKQGKVDLQLVFELQKQVGGQDELLVWQTQVVTATFERDIDISQSVNNAYPDIIKELTEQTAAAVTSSQNAVEVANNANEKSNETAEFASSVVVAENQRQQNELERQQAEQNRAAAWANAEGIKQIVVTDEATNKKYGYQIRIVEGKPKMIIDEI